MRSFFLFLFLLNILQLKAQDIFQLAPPLLKYNSIFFSKSMQLDILFAQPGATVHYTLDGKEPSEKTTLYKKPLFFTKSYTTLKARSFAPGYRPSETITISFIKSGRDYSIGEQTNPSDKYIGEGPNTLNDNKGGFATLGSKTWLGYNTDTVNYVLQFGKKVMIKELLFDFLQNEGSWVFLPERIQVFYKEAINQPYKLFGEEIFEIIGPAAGARCEQRKITGKKTVSAQSVQVRIVPIKKIPDWHAAKGEHAWLFIDEIKVY